VGETASIATPETYRLWFTWPCCKGTKNATLAEIFQMENGARALIEISEWDKADANAKNYIIEFMERDFKRAEVFRLVREQLKAERKQRRTRTGGTHAERERQREFGF
jgi:hypothetical protein